jgi:hypothetical protein
MKRQMPKSNILSAILIILSSGLICGLFGLVTYIVYPDMWDSLLLRRPEYMFRILIADPIPEGVSNIQVLDISFAFDTEIVGAFRATPESIDEIITLNDLELGEFSSAPPFEYFPNIDPNKEWQCYERSVPDEVLFLSIWVTPERDVALFSYVDG